MNLAGKLKNFTVWSLGLFLMVSFVGVRCNGQNESNDQDNSKEQQAEESSQEKEQESFENRDVKIAKVETEYGEILIWLYEATPKHRENFLKLASDGFYDSTTFHRVMDGFMIQGGDPNTRVAKPTNPGNGGPGYKIEAEIRDDLKHNYGAVAAARKSDRVNPKRKSSGSQFYIVENKDGTPQLDGKYTVFGQVITGMDAVETIAEQPTKAKNQPKDPIRMQVEVVETTTKQLADKHDFRPPEINE